MQKQISVNLPQKCYPEGMSLNLLVYQEMKIKVNRSLSIANDEGKPKYPLILSLFNRTLSLSHGNIATENGFL